MEVLDQTSQAPSEAYEPEDARTLEERVLAEYTYWHDQRQQAALKHLGDTCLTESDSV